MIVKKLVKAASTLPLQEITAILATNTVYKTAFGPQNLNKEPSYSFGLSLSVRK